MLLDIEPKYGSCNEIYLGEGEGSAGALLFFVNETLNKK